MSMHRRLPTRSAQQDLESFVYESTNKDFRIDFFIEISLYEISYPYETSFVLSEHYFLQLLCI